MVDIAKYFHKFYRNYEEIKEIARIENILLNDAEKELNTFILNQFIVSADSETISEYENIFNIPNNSDSIDFRRNRILNRLSLSPPFPLEFLRNKLDLLIGKGNYTLSVDYENYTLYIESSASDQNWFNETYITVNKIKPANIVFINKPITIQEIKVNEYLEVSSLVYNYKLGIWNIGQKPFLSLGNKEVLKLPEGKSIDNNLIRYLKQSIVDKISYVKLNDSFIIRDFLNKDVVDDKVLIEYRVNKNSLISEITNVALYDNLNNKLSSIDLYVPVSDGMQLKHLLDVKEGV